MCVYVPRWSISLFGHCRAEFSFLDSWHWWLISDSGRIRCARIWWRSMFCQLSLPRRMLTLPQDHDLVDRLRHLSWFKLLYVLIQSYLSKWDCLRICLSFDILFCTQLLARIYLIKYPYSTQLINLSRWIAISHSGRLTTPLQHWTPKNTRTVLSNSSTITYSSRLCRSRSISKVKPPARLAAIASKLLISTPLKATSLELCKNRKATTKRERLAPPVNSVLRGEYALKEKSILKKLLKTISTSASFRMNAKISFSARFQFIAWEPGSKKWTTFPNPFRASTTMSWISCKGCKKQRNLTKKNQKSCNRLRRRRGGTVNRFKKYTIEYSDDQAEPID